MGKAGPVAACGKINGTGTSHVLTIPFFSPCDQILFLSCVILHSVSPPIKKLYKAVPPDWASSRPSVFPGYGCPQSFQPSECCRSAEWRGNIREKGFFPQLRISLVTSNMKTLMKIFKYILSFKLSESNSKSHKMVLSPPHL